MSNPERKLADNLNADRPESSTDNEAFDLMRLMPNQIRYAPAKYLSIKKKLPITSANTAIPKTAKNTKTRSPTTIPAATALPFENPADEERATTKATLVLGTSAKVTIAANRANISPRLIVIPMLNAWLCGVPERQRRRVRQQPLVKLLRSPDGEYHPG